MQPSYVLLVLPPCCSKHFISPNITYHCLPGQIDTFLKELRFFIDMTEEEQRLQMTHHLPTVEEYSRRRMGSSAVRVCLAINEYELFLSQRCVCEGDFQTC